MGADRPSFDRPLALFVDDDLALCFHIGKFVRIEQWAPRFVCRARGLAEAVTVRAFRPPCGLAAYARGQLLRRGID